MPLDIKELVTSRLGENYDLHDQHVNRTLVKVLRTIGFDKVYARAQGAYLYDMDGRDYLDFLSGYGVFNIGRNHPGVQKVIRDVLDMDLPNMVQMDCALLSGLLAEALTKRTGPGLDAVFFCNSGTESVEGAIKFARCATGRTRILSLQNSYHGLSYGSLSITGNKNFQNGFGPFLPGAEQVKNNDLEDLESKLRAGDVACFIAELVQGKGVYIPDDDYFPKAQALCRKYGALFIADEVQTGLGRTGKFFAFQHWNLEPDILTIAKALSGGYVPAAAFVTRREIYQKVFSSLDRCVVHSTTFGRNNLAMACGLATLEILDDEKIVENAAKRGEQLIRRLRSLQEKHDIIKEIRGKGLMIAIEFKEPSSLKLKVAWKAVHAVDKGLFPQMVVTQLLSKHRILTQVAGHHMDVLKILPPLIIGDEEIERFVNALDDVVGNIASFPGPFWEFGSGLVKAAITSGYNKKAAAI
ncbi:MAG: aspartate aminotransferase family protein [Methylacidiphilales bacterium]|nr:aspartate aminotransferase family protein [Candidatus Methylacidiphilales bacterium]